MYRLLRYKDLYVPIQAPACRMAGWFKMDAIRPDGRVRPLMDWSPNLILNDGLNSLGSTSIMSYCHVGTNNTAPVVTQTSLQGWLAKNSTTEENPYGLNTVGTIYGWQRRRYRFNQGVATGNIQEVGIAQSTTNAGPFWSRALTVDGGGSPTTITVLADEVLDVTYELRNYPPVVQEFSGGPFNIGGTNYNVIGRPANIDGASNWYQYLGSQARWNPTSGYWGSVYNGSIGDVYNTPSGSAASSQISTAAYSNNSLQADGTFSFNLNDGNLTNGIKSISVGATYGLWQYEFDAYIPKDNTKTCAFSVRFSWDRYTPP